MGREFQKKESARLRRQNRRNVPAMTAILPTACKGLHLTLSVGLLLACAANAALVCVWL